jgi:hypothetical protein
VTQCRLTPKQQRVLSLLNDLADDRGVVRLSNAGLCAHLRWTVGRNGTSTMLSEVLRELEGLGYITRAVVHRGGPRTERTIVVVGGIPQAAAHSES